MFVEVCVCVCVGGLLFYCVTLCYMCSILLFLNVLYKYIWNWKLAIIIFMNNICVSQM